MKPVLVVYATREGHTHRVADHIAELLHKRDYETAVVDAKQVAPPVELGNYCAVIVAASVHMGKHEPEIVTFVRGHRETLSEMPAAFLSVSLAEAGAEDGSTPQPERDRAITHVHETLDRFFSQTEWHPEHVRPVAGALMYSKYGWLVKWVMKRIARRTGASTDTSRDHVYTDWKKLDEFVEEFVTKEVNPTQNFRVM